MLTINVFVCGCVFPYICEDQSEWVSEWVSECDMQPFTQVDLHNFHGEVLLDEQVGVCPEGVQHGQHPFLVV